MAYTQPISEQRYYISKHHRNLPLRQIAHTIGCHPATVGREIRRHSPNGTYCCQQAQKLSEAKKKNKTARKMTDAVKQTVSALITRKYSPEQVCAHLRRHQGIRLHHSTVYRHLKRDCKNGSSLHTRLRIVSKPYRRTYGSDAWTKGKAPDRTDIKQACRCCPKSVHRRFRDGYHSGKRPKKRAFGGSEAENQIHRNPQNHGLQSPRRYHSWEKGLVENTTG